MNDQKVQTEIKALKILTLMLAILAVFVWSIFILEKLYPDIDRKPTVIAENSLNMDTITPTVTVVKPIIKSSINTSFSKDAKMAKDIVKKSLLTDEIISQRDYTSDYCKLLVSEIYKQSYKTGLPVNVIVTLIEAESDFSYRANSNLGAEYGRGLMQVSENGLIDYNLWNGTKYKPKDLYNISINLEVGCWCFLQNEYYITKSKAHTLCYDHLYVAYNVGAQKFKNHKHEYINNYGKGKDYNALKRWDKLYNKWENYFGDV
jgi:soluble lytic murein transglycosylase-like protein